MSLVKQRNKSDKWILFFVCLKACVCESITCKNFVDKGIVTLMCMYNSNILHLLYAHCNVHVHFA